MADPFEEIASEILALAPDQSTDQASEKRQVAEILRRHFGHLRSENKRMKEECKLALLALEHYGPEGYNQGVMVARGCLSAALDRKQ